MYGRQSVWQRPDRDMPEANPAFNLVTFGSESVAGNVHSNCA